MSGATEPEAGPRGVDPRAIADRVADSLEAPEVRGGLAMFLLRSALRWAVARGSVGAHAAAEEERWSERANEGRLLAETLRYVAWSLVLEDDGSKDAVARAAAVIGAALSVRGDLAEGSAGELLFGTTLVPGEKRFEVHRGKGRHILVGASENLWAVEVLDESGAIHDEATLSASLRRCLGAIGSGSPILAITAAPRREAAAVWPTIVRQNPESARLLSDAIFSVFFDPAAPPDVDMTGRLAQGGPLTSRCFWHALHVVVFRNAKAALVGSFVAGVAADGALEIGARLDAARSRERRSGQGTEPPAPVKLGFQLDERATKLLEGIGRGAAMNAGGFLRVPGFGRSAWKRGPAPPSAEGAIFLALRLALDEALPELDELECMIGLAHVHRGLVTRLGSTTPEMRALVGAARREEPLAEPLARALVVHRARVAEAKRRESAEVAFEYAALVLGRVGGFARAVVAAIARAVAVLIAVRTPPPARRMLPAPLVAVDSSVPRPPGISAVGRFGVLAPPRSVWIHHSLAEDEVSFVIQLGPDQVAQAARLREAIPKALARVLAATGDKAVLASKPSTAPATRVAYRRLLGLLAALRPRA